MSVFILSAPQLRALAKSYGVPDSAIKLRDSEYKLPTESWVTGTFSTWFTAWLKRNNYVYRPNSRDCDKFARKAAAMAGDCNAVTEERLGVDPDYSYGLAFGELKLPTLAHSINVAIHRPQKTLVLVAYEPQLSLSGLGLVKVSMNIVKLTGKDWEACNDFDI